MEDTTEPYKVSTIFRAFLFHYFAGDLPLI